MCGNLWLHYDDANLTKCSLQKYTFGQKHFLTYTKIQVFLAVQSLHKQWSKWSKTSTINTTTTVNMTVWLKICRSWPPHWYYECSFWKKRNIFHIYSPIHANIFSIFTHLKCGNMMLVDSPINSNNTHIKIYFGWFMG